LRFTFFSPAQRRNKKSTRALRDPGAGAEKEPSELAPNESDAQSLY
jgi:hypothetical protein